MNNHISTSKNLLVSLTILILSSLLNPGCGGTTSPPITVNKTIYRALCVGVGDLSTSLIVMEISTFPAHSMM